MNTHIYSLSTLILCGLSGLSIGVGIMYWIYRIKKRRMIEEFCIPSEPLKRLISLLLYNAAKENADCIVFGTLPRKYKIEEREPKHKLSEDDLKFIEDFEKETQELIDKSPDTYFPFKDSDVTGLPIWYCSQGTCYQDDDIPLYLFTSLIDCFLYYEQEGIHISEWANDPSRILYTIEMRETYCYSIKINKIEEIPNL
jgi:hypothetical protein